MKNRQQKLTSIISDIELVYRRKETMSAYLTSSAIAARIAREAIPEGQLCLREYFGVLMVNRQSRIVKRSIISIGGESSVIVDPKIVLMTALLSGVSAFVLFHNHPSGDPHPSCEDRRMTRRIEDGAKIMDLALLDHVIVTDKSHYSFADAGLL